MQRTRSAWLKHTIRLVRRAKIQIIIIRSDCAFYSLRAIQRGIKENPCHTGWMSRQIWYGHTGLIVVGYYIISRELNRKKRYVDHTPTYLGKLPSDDQNIRFRIIGHWKIYWCTINILIRLRMHKQIWGVLVFAYIQKEDFLMERI